MTFEEWFELKKEKCEVYGNGDDFCVDDEIKHLCKMAWDEQQKQIEKMKCCQNCKHYVMNGKRFECERMKLSLVALLCHNKDKWELAE